jgi:ribose transport system permease protein
MTLPALERQQRLVGSRDRAKSREILSRHAILAAALVVLVAFALTAPSFGTPGNAVNILKQSSPILVLGLGMTLVVLVGGIDLSVGSVVLLSSTVAAAALQSGAGATVAVLAAVASGAAVGGINALLVEALRISPVIVTLGTMISMRGLALTLLARFKSSIQVRDPLFDGLAKWSVLGLPAVAVLAALLALLLWLLLRGSLLGRRLHAIGDNAAAARLSGVRPERLRALAYVGSGALAGVAGIMTASRTGVISPSIGTGMEFYAIAVVALGAGGLPGGRLKVGQTVVGAIILMAVFNYLTIRGVPGTWQTTVTGLLLLAAVVGGRVIQGPGDSDMGALAEVYRGGFVRGWRALLGRYAIAAATLALVGLFTFANPRFATLANFLTLIEQNAALAIISVGALIGILSRSVDISPGSVAALGAVAAALSLQGGLPMTAALGVGALACLAVYTFNGIIVGRLGIDPLIITLAAWIWARGLAVSLTGAQTIPFDPGFVGFMNAPLQYGIRPPVLFIAVAFLLGWLVLARLPIGPRLYALGSDRRMLRQGGVDDRATATRALILMGCFTAIGMIVMLGRLGAAAPTAGFGLELDAIVAVIIGGASFRGGDGRLRDTAIGVAFLAVLNNGLSGLQMSDATFYLAKGGGILAALIMQTALASLPAGQRTSPKV